MPKISTSQDGYGPVLDHVALQAALEQAADRLLTLPNLVGLGLGEKIRAGEPTGETAVVFYVARKLQSRAEVLQIGSDDVPETVDLLGKSYPTDVVVERWRIDNADAATAKQRKRCDPVVPGISVGGPGIETGTIGAIVRRRTTGEVCVLSNWHVFGDAGGAVTQPGRLDGAVPADTIGNVVGTLFERDGDAAVATLGGRHFDPRIAELGVAVTAVAAPIHGEFVTLVGRTSGKLRGKVKLLQPATMIRTDERTGYSFLISCFAIEPLIANQPFVQGGDSGGAWMRCDATGRSDGTIVGLHFGAASQGGNAVACFAERVFKRLDIIPFVASLDEAPLTPPIAKPPTGAAKPEGVIHKVVATTAPIRRFPTQTGAITGQRKFGDLVWVIGRYDDFYTIDLNGDGAADGYMFNDVLRTV